MSRLSHAVGLTCVLMTIAAGRVPALRLVPTPPPGSAASGERLFNRRCTGCHSLVEHRTGRRLGDVYGRRAGSATGFRYSDAVAGKNFAWSDSTLDVWLAGPRDFIPGAAMPVRIGDAQERADVIAYLRRVTLSTDPSRAAMHTDRGADTLSSLR